MPEFLLHAVVSLPHVNGLPADAAVNTFNFFGVADPYDPASAASGFEASIAEFYNTVTPTSGLAICDFINESIDRAANACTMTWYDTNEGVGPLGSPVRIHQWTLGVQGPDAVPIPREVALCSSYHGSYSGIDEDTEAGPAGPVGNIHGRARRRGRIYLGPLNGISIDSDPTVSRPSDDLIVTAAEATKRLADHEFLCVWSRVGEPHHHAITGGWVDNAFDTQRRRGEAASTRTTWTAD